MWAVDDPLKIMTKPKTQLGCSPQLLVRARTWGKKTDAQIIAMPPQPRDREMVKLPNEHVRNERKRLQKQKWYHDNKDWVNQKRNESRRDRYKADMAFRARRQMQGRKPPKCCGVYCRRTDRVRVFECPKCHEARYLKPLPSECLALAAIIKSPQRPSSATR